MGKTSKGVSGAPRVPRPQTHGQKAGVANDTAAKKQLRKWQEGWVSKRNARLDFGTPPTEVVSEKKKDTPKKSEYAGTGGLGMLAGANLAAVPVAILAEAATLFTNNVVADCIFAFVNLVVGIALLSWNAKARQTAVAAGMSILVGALPFGFAGYLISPGSFPVAYGISLILVMVARLLLLQRPKG